MDFYLFSILALIVISIVLIISMFKDRIKDPFRKK